MNVTHASALEPRRYLHVTRLMPPRSPWLVVAAMAALGVTWIGVLLAFPRERAAFILPPAPTGLEIPIAALWMIAGVALFSFPSDLVHDRLRWVAAAFLTLAIAGLLLGYFLPLAVDDATFDTMLWCAWLSQTTAGALAAIGLWATPRALQGRRLVWGALAGYTATLCLVFAIGDRLPALTRVSTLAGARHRPFALGELTTWHWALAAVPLALMAVAVAGAVRWVAGGMIGGWLVIGLMGLAVAQVHDALWPVAFTPAVSQATRVRLVLAAIVAISASLEMQGVAAKRAALLASERATSARLTELNRLREEFTGMVAHELGNPLAGVRRATELASLDPLTPSQERALTMISREIVHLEALVADVQVTAAVDRDEFTIHPVPVDVRALLEDAAGYARVLPGDRAIAWPVEADERVRADPERIGQVLRNLLANAAKYTAPGAPVAVRVHRAGPRLRVEVSDRGPGIDAADLPRVFNKYGRGGDACRQPGTGLGLYLSRQIARAHGGDLHVVSEPGQGTTFWFDLERLP